MSERAISSAGTLFSVQTGVVDVGAIASATAAAPSVLTLTDAPAAVLLGELVRVSGTYWGSLRDQTFAVGMHYGANVLLTDSDSSRETGPIGPGTLQRVTMGESCMASFAIEMPEGDDIDITTICSPTQRTAAGDPGVITWSATGFWNASDGFQQRFKSLYRTREVVAFRVVFRDGSGFLFSGSLTHYAVRAVLDQAVQFEVGGIVIDQLHDLAPPVVPGSWSPTRPIFDPNYVIQPEDDGWTLVWDSDGDADWELPAYDTTMEVNLLRANVGELQVHGGDGSTLQSAYDAFDDPHRAIARRWGQMVLRMRAPALWLISGETKPAAGAMMLLAAPTGRPPEQWEWT